ncbi:type I polyketide synthase, partial [Streptomyces sp. NPDC059740]
QGVAAMAGAGVRTFLELAPDAVLTPMINDTLGPDVVAVPAMRRDRPEPETVVSALAAVHLAGHDVDWDAFLGKRTAHRTELPTYPFQHQRYWLDAPSASGGTAAGQTATGHRLLGSAVSLAGEGRTVLTGGLSLAAQPWLADHAVLGTVLLPGAALAEFAVTAGRHTACPRLAELTLQEPLVLTAGTGAAVQVSVDPPEADGSRAVTVYSRPEDAQPADAWRCHARGRLTPGDPAPLPAGTTWPPEGAQPEPVEHLYTALADRGIEYGPVFQGLRGAWRRGEEVYAEVELPGTADPSGFAVHPALLDAALHSLALRADESADGGILLPFSWREVELFGTATAPRTLRVATRPTPDGELALTAHDTEGQPVLSVAGLALRPVTGAQLRAAGASDARLLHETRWRPVPSANPAAGDWAVVDDLAELGRDADLPATVLLRLPAAGEDAGSALRAAYECAARLRQWAEDPRTTGSRLVVLTHRALAVREGEVPDPAGAAAWSVVRTAQWEHPGSFAAVDLDRTEAPELLALAAALPADEEQAVVREGEMSVARLARTADGTPPAAPAASFPESGTVLVTGGTGGLGAAVARHLASVHGVRRLLLLSRRGPAAEGAEALVRDLALAGAEATVVACDVGDRSALAEVLSDLPPDAPLGAVVHTAGVVDDALLRNLTEEQFAHAFHAKAAGARHLHELTAGLDLSAFVLFSSAAGTLGSPGQAAYAAANGYLDALAALRHGRGLPALSLAWGVWDLDSGIAGRLEGTDRARLSRSGLAPMAPEEALACFEAALRQDRPVLLAARTEPAALRELAAAGMLPAVVRELAPAVPAGGDDGANRFGPVTGLPPEEQRAAVQGLVSTTVADVLGHDSALAVPLDRPFQELGFDSLTAVELRNRLGAATGLTLPATLVFDRPTPAALADWLLERLAPAEDPGAEEARLRAALAAIPYGRFRDAGLLDALWRLAGGDEDPTTPEAQRPDQEAVDAMDADALVDLVLGDTDNDLVK